jgi:hypothetical protein
VNLICVLTYLWATSDPAANSPKNMVRVERFFAQVFSSETLANCCFHHLGGPGSWLVLCQLFQTATESVCIVKCIVCVMKCMHSYKSE